MATVIDVQPQVDVETGEIGGQLMFGIVVPVVPVVEIQQRGMMRMDETAFNATEWHLDEGDKLTVTIKDGVWVVRITKAWE